MTRIVRWAATAVIVTALFSSLYLVMQQIERQGADDAPGRLASQLASELTAGSGDDASAPAVDLAASDSLFYVVYDRSDHPVAGTGQLDGSLATVPAGVLDQARRAGSNHVTWQDSAGRRFATVEQRAGDRVVLAGQSLAPTEDRVDRIGLLILAAWACVLAIVVVAYLIERLTSRVGSRS